MSIGKIVTVLTAAAGLLANPTTAMATAVLKGQSPEKAVMEWLSHLFESGYHEFLLTLIIGAPFLVAALVFRTHLREGAPRGRVYGAPTALLAATIFNVYALTAIRLSHSSTAAIGYLFLPFYSAVLFVIAYPVGRLIARLRG